MLCLLVAFQLLEISRLALAFVSFIVLGVAPPSAGQFLLIFALRQILLRHDLSAHLRLSTVPGAQPFVRTSSVFSSNFENTLIHTFNWFFNTLVFFLSRSIKLLEFHHQLLWHIEVLIFKLLGFISVLYTREFEVDEGEIWHVLLVIRPNAIFHLK